MTDMIKVEGLQKAFQGTQALRGVDATIPRAKLTVVAGPSGSGKTTLLNLIASLDRADSGTVMVDGIDVTALKSKARDEYRASNGHVFQRSGLLTGLTVRDNITAPHYLSGKQLDDRWLESLFRRLRLTDFMDRPASTLSGGQAQRVALARALAHQPSLVLADEPTASLDTEAKRSVLNSLRSVVVDLGVTVLMVSHDQIANDYADHVLTLVDGAVTLPQAAAPTKRRRLW